jgi:hypothetical protein
VWRHLIGDVRCLVIVEVSYIHCICFIFNIFFSIRIGSLSLNIRPYDVLARARRCRGHVRGRGPRVEAEVAIAQVPRARLGAGSTRAKNIIQCVIITVLC